MPDPRTGCERWQEVLEAYVDGELDAPERSRLENHLEGCPACRSELALASELRDRLRGLPSLDAPRGAVAAVLETARQEDRAQRGPAPWSWLETLWARPLLAGGAAAAIVLAIVLALFPGDGGPAAPGSDAEIARATLEAKLALAHFARANRKVALGVGEDVIRERMMMPTGRAVARSLTMEESLDGSGTTPNERG